MIRQLYASHMYKPQHYYYHIAIAATFAALLLPWCTARELHAAAVSHAVAGNYGAGWEQLTPAQRVDACAELEPLYENVHADLNPWAQSGIDSQLMVATVKRHTMRTTGQKGIALAFIKGRAYLIDKPELSTRVGHHVGIFIIYMKAMLELERQFGTALPDVEFVISTIDRPLKLASETNGTHEPVMRFCKTDSHTDILIPNFHSYIEQYTAGLMSQVPSINHEFPWKAKQPVLFGRFTPYFRHMHRDDPTTHRMGVNGEVVCRNESLKVAACPIRQYFCNWAAQSHKDTMDVSCNKRTSMFNHASYKYLLHLDGQGLSSRFEQLLYLQSVVFKEESGYRAYFYNMLKPYEHFIPFWKQYPEEILPALEWAKANEDKAQQIAKNAQDFVLKYLNSRGRACYWHKLLSEYAKLLKYQPGKAAGRRYMQYWMPVEEFLQTVAKEYNNGISERAYTFIP